MSYEDNIKLNRDYLFSVAFRLDLDFISDLVLRNDKFMRWTGSSKPEIHHYGDYGLLQHTREVVELCLETNKLMDAGIDERLLFLAALFHDFGKIYDYEKVEGIWGPTPHKFKIHHIARSALLWQSAAIGFLSPDEVNEVMHAILAHHGRHDWGSPIKPQTKLAWMLHLCDSLSGRLDDCKE